MSWLLQLRGEQFSRGLDLSELAATRLGCTSCPLFSFDRLCTLDKDCLWWRPEEMYCMCQQLRITQHAAQLRNSDRQQTNPVFLSRIRC